MAKELKQRCIIYGVGVFLYICMIVATMQKTIPDCYKFIMFLIVYLIIGFEAFRTLSEGLLQKKIPTDYLMIILATVGAFGVGRYIEGVVVMLFFELGMLAETVSTVKAKRSIEEMLDIRPTFAVRKIKNEEILVEPAELELGDTIVIKPGERIPVDAVITLGTTTIDTKALTGEAIPERAGWGEAIYSGCINLSGAIEARVTKVYEDSTVARIMEMVEDAQNNKGESEAFVTRFSKIYTPIMFICAIVLMMAPPMTFSYGNWDTWIYRGLIFLVVACPCGLIMSVPVAFLGGIASAAKQGVIIKGGNYLENLAKADTFVFDKTGTLTEGGFKVVEIHAEGMEEEELLKIAAHVESYSNHPIAQSLVAAYKEEVDQKKVYGIQESPGFGVSAIYGRQRVHIGNLKMMEAQNVYVEPADVMGTAVYICVDEKYAGYIVIRDSIKEDARETLAYLKNKWHAALVMLTGDARDSAMEVAEELEMDYAYTNLMPEEKLEQLEDFLFIQDDTEKLVCVGDGINDAPVLARADVGIAMGNLGSAAAIEAADVILMEDELSKIIDAIHIAKETLRVVSQNITFALFVKFLVLIFAVFGFLGMWEAILVEVGVMFVAILNATWVVKYAG